MTAPPMKPKSILDSEVTLMLHEHDQCAADVYPTCHTTRRSRTAT